MKLTDPNDLLAAAVAKLDVPPGCCVFVMARHPGGMRAWWQDFEKAQLVQDLRHLADHIEKGGTPGTAVPN